MPLGLFVKVGLAGYDILFTYSIVDGKIKRAENDQWTEASASNGPLTIFGPFYFRPFLFSAFFIFRPFYFRPFLFFSALFILGPFLFGPMIFGP